MRYECNSVLPEANEQNDFEGVDTSVAHQVLVHATSDLTRAKQTFPNYRLTELVLARLNMTESEAAAFVDFCDAIPPEFRWLGRAPFCDHLRDTIERLSLGLLFSEDGPGQHHHAIRPTGYDYYADAVDPIGMEQWRADYRAMTPARQMFAATIIWLYRGKKDRCWLRRVPCTWHAVDAMGEMREQGILADWGRLVALYPGW